MKFSISILNSGCAPEMRIHRATVHFALSRRSRFFGPGFKTFDACANHLRHAKPRSA